MERLLYRVDGQNNQKMISLLWKIWFVSGYKELDPEHNKLISITENSPVILDYRSDKKLGFHTDNAGIDWNFKQNTIDVNLVVGTGVYQTSQAPDGEGGIKIITKEVNETFQYSYHPFSPIAFHIFILLCKPISGQDMTFDTSKMLVPKKN
ncbi:hypothetical protein J2X31_003466 [Flavobacterium arsenatis]|uniref:Uncharacterized protein n=1 Tax=Flavobacterium arsenatis TaxID=1484332 RepID=A0ABU1TU84_9FLAO|nr:hypothetical protein [Flavobacterium arsenatis]MDR6969435.1 hypothetical protein [Flavobacterium arsenatis]